MDSAHVVPWLTIICFFLPVTSTTNLRQQARTPPPRRGAKKWAKTYQERGLSICYCSCRHSALVGWAAPRRVYLQWKSLHQVCTSYDTSCTVNWYWFTHRPVYTKFKPFSSYTKFTHEKQKTEKSLHQPKKSLHKVCKSQKKFTQSLKSPEIVYTRFEKRRKSLHKV